MNLGTIAGIIILIFAGYAIYRFNKKKCKEGIKTYESGKITNPKENKRIGRDKPEAKPGSRNKQNNRNPKGRNKVQTKSSKDDKSNKREPTPDSKTDKSDSDTVTEEQEKEVEELE